MVANAPALADRFVLPPLSVRVSKSRMLKFTRDDVATLVKLGIIPEDASTELLDGVIVLVDRSAEGEDILRVGKAHRITVERLARLSQLIDNDKRHVETQQPLNCGDTQEPQPDFMIVRGTLDQIDADHPAAQDVFCLIEVSDSSYEKDSGEKLLGYARAGIRQYIIINLRNRTAEVYSQPETAVGTYPAPIILTERDSLSVRVSEDETVSVQLSQLLP